jgi:hypothetical protein
MDADGFVHDCFIKWESYPLDDAGRTKWPRSISACRDLLHQQFGPFFKRIEERLYEHLYNDGEHFAFVKKLAVSERPGHIQRMFGDQAVVASDFTSFEAHHKGAIARAIRKWVSQTMEGDAQHDRLLRLFDLTYGGDHIYFDYRRLFGVRSSVLHSGDVWTASANAVANLLATLYLRERSLRLRPGSSDDELLRSVDMARHTPVVIEGDDGLVAGYSMDP